MSLNINDSFSFFIPATFEKAKNKQGKEEMRLKGVCSSLAEDSDGETLEPVGFDFDPLLKKGFLNWDHQAKKRASAIVGEPDIAKVINGGKDFYIEGFLYPDSKEAQDIYQLAQVLEKNSKTRRLGWSIEGQVIEKDPLNDKKIKRARITGVAITPCPKNPNTLVSIMKGQCTNAIMDSEYDEEIIKAMDAIQAEGVTQAEHIEGTNNPNKIPLEDKKCPNCTDEKKCMECNQVGTLIKKSEIYNLIAKSYTTDPVVAKQIYNLIEATNQKLYNMSKITRESVDKAFAFLNKAAEESTIIKSETVEVEVPVTEEIQKGENNDSDDLEKAKMLCKSLLEKGSSRDEAIDEIEKSGLSVDAVSCVDGCIAEAQAKKDGDTAGTPVTPSVVKSEEVEILEKEEVAPTVNFSELIKGLSNELKGHSDKKFDAIGKILLHADEQNQFLKSQIDELAKKVEKFEKTPQPSKSLRTVGATERFAKSDSAEELNVPKGAQVYEITKSDDCDALSSVMFNKATTLRESGRSYGNLEKAISELELCKSVDRNTINFLKSENIYLTKGGNLL